MKPKTNVMILVCLAMIISLILIAMLLFNKNNINRLLKDEDIQVDMLFEIYNNMLNEYNIDNINVVLDESALKNLLTNEEYKEENILKLKRIEKNIEDSDSIYTISMQYSKKTYMLTIDITKSKGSYMKTTQKYKLEVKDGKITYQRNGQGIIVVE